MDFDYFDDDGYPTDEALDYLQSMSYTKVGGFKPVIDFAENLWSPYGRFETKEDEKNYYVCCATGGWSGNESVIWALKENKSFFWTICWVMSKRGGYHEFEIRKYNENGMPL
jgi:hypothetical protein